MVARRRPLPRAFRALLPTVLLVAAVACSGDPVSALPVEFQARSDVPLVRGTIVERSARDPEHIHIRVKDETGDPTRVSQADVSVSHDVLLRWRDGSRATAADLRVGRRVVVWATWPPNDQYPSTAVGQAILLERW